MWIAKEKPPFVYKYCSAARCVQILKDLTFYFAPIAQLNDLFEFRPRSLYIEDTDSKYKVFAKRLMAEGWYSNYEDAFEAARSLQTAGIDTTYEFFLDQLYFFLERVMKHSGVTCFSSQRNNQRMWGTYGDNHSGACIEFSTSPKNSRFASHLMPVIYTNSKIPICPSELITEAMALDQWMTGVFFCIKHLDWMGENEWRLLLLADQEQTTQDRLVSFERTAITRVFLGPRISEEQEGLVRDMASRLRPGVPIFKRKIDEHFAREEYEGVEVISSFDQLAYWFAKPGTEKPE